MNADRDPSSAVTWGPFLMAPPPEKVSFRVVALAMLGLGLAVAGALFLVDGIEGFGPAYAERDRTGEGVGLIVPGFSLISGGLLVALAASLLLLASVGIARRPALVLRVTSAMCMAGVGSCALAAMWTVLRTG